MEAMILGVDRIAAFREAILYVVGWQGWPSPVQLAMEIEAIQSGFKLPPLILPAYRQPARQHFPFNVPFELLNHVCQAFVTRQYREYLRAAGKIGVTFGWGLHILEVSPRSKYLPILLNVTFLGG